MPYLTDNKYNGRIFSIFVSAVFFAPMIDYWIDGILHFLLFVCFALFFLMKANSIKIYLISAGLVFLFGLILQKHITDANISLEDFIFFFKLMICFILLLILILSLKTFHISKKSFNWFLYSMAFVVLLNTGLGILGLGYRTYNFSDGWGSKGLFISGNELSNALIILTLTIVLNSDGGKAKLLIIYSFCLAVVGTKSGIIISFSSLLFLIRQTIFRYLITLAVLILLTWKQLVVYFSPLYERLVWLLEARGLISLFFSGRQDFLETVLSDSRLYDVQSLLLGNSLERQIELLNKKLVEIDFFDLLYLGGVSLPLIYCAVFGALIFRRDSNAGQRLLSLALLSLSILPGHVMYSSIVIPVFCICYSGLRRETK